MPQKIVLSWSGGKDSSLALYRLLHDDNFIVSGLFTAYNGASAKVGLHGVPITLIRKQAEALGLPLYEIALPPSPSNQIYEGMHLALFERLKVELGIVKIAYGDIYLEEIKAYRDAMAAKAGMEFYYPLWAENPSALAMEVINKGFKNVIISIDASKLSNDFLGKQYDQSFIDYLPAEVDKCGERGEFHSFAWDGPHFNNPVKYVLSEIYSEDYRPAINMKMNYIEINPV
jgi:uncharacterized protein (TIGR00290 family)